MNVLGNSASTARAARLLGAAAGDLGEHLERNGPLPWRNGLGKLIAEVQAAGLTGRGGAGTPTWRKLASVATEERPVVVANAAESDPASDKDTTLLVQCPHLVLDGLQLAVETVGATAVYLYVKPGEAARAAHRALAERASRRFDHFPVRVVEAERTILAGEESAVLARIAGRRGPFTKRRLTGRDRLAGRATLVQNVETLAHIAQIARHGAGWFRRLGTQDEPGTFLTTVGDAVVRPGVYEVPVGTLAADVITVAGGASEPVRAALIGGYHGIWLPFDRLGRTPLSRAALVPLGGWLGAGVISVLPASRCGLRETADILRYLAAQGGGGDLPGVTGLFAALASPGASRDVADRVLKLSTVDRGGLVRSAVETFGSEIERHLAGECSADIGR